MTDDTTTTTAPEVGQPRALPAEPEPEGIATLRAERDAAEPRRHSLRRVTVHGTAVSAVGGLTTLAHVAGPTVAGAAAAGVAAVASGAVAYSRRKPKARRSRRIRSGRTRTATSRSATARRSGATKSATAGRNATATARRRSIRATPTGATRPRSATGSSRRGGATRRATGGGATGLRRNVRRHFGRQAATGSRATRPGVRHGRRHGGLTPSPAGSRAARNTTRRAATTTTTRRPGSTARTAPARTAARRATRQAARGQRYTSFTDPSHHTTPVKKAAAKKTAAAKKAPAAKTGKTAPGKPITPPGNGAAKKAAPRPPAKKTAPKTQPKPGSPVTAPGRTPKASTPVTTTETQALTEAIQQNIGGFEPKHALDVEAFLVGLNETFSELSNSLSVAAERLRGDFPIEASVTDLIDQMGVHAATLGEYAQEGHRVFRLAHAADLERHENPRPQEEAWDVSTRE